MLAGYFASIAALGADRGERACRIGLFQDNFVKRICAVGWVWYHLRGRRLDQWAPNVISAVFASGVAAPVIMSLPTCLLAPGPHARSGRGGGRGAEAIFWQSGQP